MKAKQANALPRKKTEQESNPEPEPTAKSKFLEPEPIPVKRKLQHYKKTSSKVKFRTGRLDRSSERSSASSRAGGDVTANGFQCQLH